ncbi:BTAD domain-containing putative transcriptional regulator [Streptomyces sp. NRRL S-87]|uniref:AfsR/SARP family transcriptional regulator n=1 Tax=Streptomyces sp. NRRL S-87 TaxID=1463920 RepID=UPI00068D7F9C|nr:BTAD domain-containing putative transcriptional regulator [Streptomyces sp. NRRL S-87]
MDLQLLGPVEASREGARVALSGTKMHTLLAALLLARGRVVPDTRLSRLLWGADPPATMSAQIYTYVSRLRKLLEPEVVLERRSPGYAIKTGDSRVDIVEYERLDRLGREALQEHRYAEAGTLLRDALDLWQGPMLVNVTEFLAEEEIPQWEEGRAATLENRIEADLALGRHQQIVAELTRLVADFPLRERMRAQLMTALYRCGRQADALHVFHEGRTVLADELGVDPGSGLKAAHQALLCATLDLEAPGTPVAVPAAAPSAPGPGPAPAVTVPAARRPVGERVPGRSPGGPSRPRPAGGAPRSATAATAPVGAGAATAAPAASEASPFMLPPDVAAFTGRGRELAALRGLLRAPGRGSAGEPRRGLITGMAGVGKTALAVHAVHAVREDFPDGQLYADLTTPDGSPKDPRSVLVRFLRALGQEPPESARTDLEELVRIYRTRTAGRRLVVLLDNAGPGTDLAPLLPAGPHGATLVVGHVHLAVATGPFTLALGPMNRTESLDLLTAAAGRARTAAEPAAAERIVDHCAGMALALRIAGARLASRPHWSVARLAQRLADEPTRLAELAFGELDVAGSLADWLRRTGTEERELLTRLSVLGGRPFTAAAAATVLGLPVRRAEDLVERLVDGSLLEPVRGPGAVGAPAGGSFRFHPLVLLHVQALPVQRPVRALLAPAG